MASAGGNGAAVLNGCTRSTNQSITRLADLPFGLLLPASSDCIIFGTCSNEWSACEFRLQFSSDCGMA